MLSSARVRGTLSSRESPRGLSRQQSYWAWLTGRGHSAGSIRPTGGAVPHKDQGTRAQWVGFSDHPCKHKDSLNSRCSEVVLARSVEWGRTSAFPRKGLL